MSILTPPNAPTNVVATLINGGIQVTWTDNALTESGFFVVRSTSFGAWASFMTVGPNPSTGTVTYYRSHDGGQHSLPVRSCSIQCCGTISLRILEHRAHKHCPGCTNQPNRNAAKRRPGQVVLDRPSTNETGFQVERSLNGGAYAVITTVGPKPTRIPPVTYTDATALASNSLQLPGQSCKAGFLISLLEYCLRDPACPTYGSNQPDGASGSHPGSHPDLD